MDLAGRSRPCRDCRDRRGGRDCRDQPARSPRRALVRSDCEFGRCGFRCRSLAGLIALEGLALRPTRPQPSTKSCAVR
jgi:hypothetical protein